MLNDINSIKEPLTIKVIMPSEREQSLTTDDKDMDRRAETAVKAAIEKAKVCGKPIATYDPENKKVYMEYPDGTREEF